MKWNKWKTESFRERLKSIEEIDKKLFKKVNRDTWLEEERKKKKESRKEGKKSIKKMEKEYK